MREERKREFACLGLLRRILINHVTSRKRDGESDERLQSLLPNGLILGFSTKFEQAERKLI